MKTRGPDNIIISLRWVIRVMVEIEIIPLIVAGAEAVAVCLRSTCGRGCNGGDDDTMANSRADKEDVRQIKVVTAGMADIMMYRGLGIARSTLHIAL